VNPGRISTSVSRLVSTIHQSALSQWSLERRENQKKRARIHSPLTTAIDESINNTSLEEEEEEEKNV
jgi:hypothetical protein